MPMPRGGSAQWPTGGERHARATLQYATQTKDAMGGLSVTTWTDFGNWWAKVTTMPLVVTETEASILYDVEGPYRSDLMDRFLAGTGVRLVIRDLTLKVLQLEVPQLQQRTIVAHCANAVNTQ